MYKLILNLITTVLITISLFFCNYLSGQVNQVQFGKNRVQYNDDMEQWLYYETSLFTVNWYGKSKTAGHKVVRIAEQEFKDIIKTIDFKLNEKTEFLIFADVTDLKQSNIGIEDAFLFNEDLTKTEENKIFIAFDGNHNHLRKQIREGIAAVYLNNILFGSNLQEIVQNSIMLSLPQWYKDGLISYFGEEWSQTYDLRLREVLKEKKYKSFEKLAKKEPRLAGHMFWNYIGFNYGKSAIGNLVYVTRINRNLDRGFQYVLGTSYKNMMENVWKYYQNLNSNRKIQGLAIDPKTKPILKLKKEEVATRVAFSPDDEFALVALNRQGKSKIKLIHNSTGKVKKIMKYGVRNNIQKPDINYPVFTWSPDGKRILVVYEKRDYIMLSEIDISSGKKRTQLIPERYQRIYSIAYWDDKNIIINGTQDGYDNLFMYRLTTRQTTTILDDAFDDLDMSVAEIDGEKTIYFSSNRKNTSLAKLNPDSILPIGSFDIFTLRPTDLSLSQWTLEQKTNTPDYSETLPLVANDGSLHFLTDEYKHNAVITISKHDSYPDPSQTNQRIILNDNILDLYAISHDQNDILMNIYDGKYTKLIKVNTERFKQDGQVLIRETIHHNQSPPNQSGLIKDPTAIINADKTVFNEIQEEIPDDLKFVTRFGEMSVSEHEVKPLQSKSNAEKQVPGITTMQPLNNLNIVPYQLRFKIYDTKANFDNTQLFEGLTTYAGEGGNGLYTPMGFLLKAHLRDMFENYRLEGGIRIPITLNGNETFLIYDDVFKRFDYRAALYRKVMNNRDEVFSGNQIIQRNVILLGQFEVKYPLDPFNAVKIGATVRQDKLLYKASDNLTLNQPLEATERVGLRATYILDNTLDLGLNLLSGTRVKAFGEWVKKFDVNTENGIKLDFNKGHMWVAGFDTRHYFPLDKHTIIAGRLASQVSFGSEKILYYLGGDDGWLFPTFNQETQSDPNENYAYQMPALNLRGFQYNIRNGNNYALFNGELRLPLFRYFSRKSIESSFLNNFQFVGFFDIGSAWNGWDPFSDYNPLNTVVINQPGIQVKVNYFRNPIVFGYGGGIRFLLLGYYLRLDYARGWDTGQFLKPRLHICLGTDF